MHPDGSDARTPLQELLQCATALARTLKERACRHWPCHINPQVIAYRGNQLVAVIVPQNHIRDEILELFSYAAAGFGADRLATIFEAYRAPDQARINPFTGQPWSPGGMQQLALEHNGIEKGWVEQTLAVTVANRAGDVGCRIIPYRYYGKHLVWKDPPIASSRSTGGSGRPEGYMVDRMVEAMTRPDMDTRFPEFMQLMSREERDRSAADAIMTQIRGVVILPADTQSGMYRGL